MYPPPHFLWIQHQDGTFGVYMHFQQDGVLVSKGDRVYRGAPIALVGTTGCSTDPHLHFMVMEPTGSTSIPVRFESFTLPSYQLNGCYLPASQSAGLSTNFEP